MNNGHTRESKHRIAVLEDEDVETFVAFCEYAYTGDYKVPQLPVPVPVPVPAPSPREDTRAAVVESVTSTGPSWRGTYRSDSVSSAIPPPAPSPPPGSETDCQTVRAEGEVPPVVEEDVPPEAKADEPAEAEAGPVVDAEAEAVDPEAQEPASTEPAQESPGTHEPVEPTDPLEQPKETDWAQYQVTDDTPTESGEQIAPDAAEPADDASWEAAPAYPTNTKKSKKAKGKKGKKKSQQQPLEDEPPASLTPPSTPPPLEPEVVEIRPEPEPEPEPAAEPEPVPVEDEAVEAEEDAWEEDAPAEIEEEEAPTEEPQASSLPSPMPSPSAAPTDAPEWPQPTEYPPQEDDTTLEPMSSMSPRTTSRTNSPTINAPPSPKPIIDMSFAKQSDSSPRTPGLSLWDEFATLQYNDDSTVPSTPKPSTSTTSTTTDLPYLTFHAKVYVFATRYLIPALAQLCLRKLHADLVHLPLGDDSEEYADTDADANTTIRPGTPGAPAIVLDVLRYAYTKTTRLEPINPTSATQLRENELRRLVVHYAACRVKELARWHGGSGSGSATPAVRGVGVDGTRPDSLRALLDGTPELASDLVYRMM